VNTSRNNLRDWSPCKLLWEPPSIPLGLQYFCMGAYVVGSMRTLDYLNMIQVKYSKHWFLSGILGYGFRQPKIYVDNLSRLGRLKYIQII
jgi:hypothetical protein